MTISFPYFRGAKSDSLLNRKWNESISERDARLISYSATTVGCVGTAETVLYSYTLPPSVLSSAGDLLRFLCYGSLANNSGAGVPSQGIKVYLGATTVVGVSLSSAGEAYRFSGDIVRISQSSQKTSAELRRSSTTGVLSALVSSTEDLSTSLTFKITATGLATNDITLTFLNLSWRSGQAP